MNSPTAQKKHQDPSINYELAGAPPSEQTIQGDNLYRGTFYFYMAPRNQHAIQGDETATQNVIFVL